MRAILLGVALLQDPAEARAKMEKIRADMAALLPDAKEWEKVQAELQDAAAKRDKPRFDEMLARAREIRGRLEEKTRALDALFTETRALADAGIEKQPKEPIFRDVRAELRLLTGEPALALDDARIARDLGPESADRDARLGRAHFGVTEFEAARALAESALKEDPSHLDARLLLALVQNALNQFEDAVASFGAIPADQVGRTFDALLFERVSAAARRCAELWKKELEIREKERAADDLPRVRILTSRGEIVLELFENDAPNTVANFVSLVESRFFDGTLIHRVEPNFVVQGGDPNTRQGDRSTWGTGGPGYRIADELQGNPRCHFRGTLSMANSGPDTNGSQFFLCQTPAEFLNGKHTVFGRVLEGMDVVDRMRVEDKIERAEVIRKRSHEYQPVKLSDK